MRTLRLESHIEGGYCSVFYKSKDVVAPLSNRYASTDSSDTQDPVRSAGTSIYYLLNQDDFSAWHQLQSDEIWHYYDGGSPIDIHVIDDSGQFKTYTLGNPSIYNNATFQLVIRAGWWFAAELRNKTSFGLAGCTVSPGFEYQDHKLANRDELLAKYATHETMIKKLTRLQAAVAATKTPGTLPLLSGIIHAHKPNSPVVAAADATSNTTAQKCRM